MGWSRPFSAGAVRGERAGAVSERVEPSAGSGETCFTEVKVTFDGKEEERGRAGGGRRSKEGSAPVRAEMADSPACLRLFGTDPVERARKKFPRRQKNESLGLGE